MHPLRRLSEPSQQRENLGVADVGVAVPRQEAAAIVINQAHCPILHRKHRVAAIRDGVQRECRTLDERG